MLSLWLYGCQAGSDAVERWYSPQQVAVGSSLFASHCASCHGIQAQGLIKNWKQKQADGHLPAPPLNGSGHTWHHDLPLLLSIVQHGGSLYDGQMPAFDQKLNETAQHAVIAFFQSQWDDATYEQWLQRNKKD